LFSESCALIAVAIGTAAVIWALSATHVDDSPTVTALIALPAMIGIALYSWHVHENISRADSARWRSGAVFTVLLGAVFFVIDAFVSSTSRHYDSFFQAAFHAGSPFGIFLTMLVSPIGTIVCVGGWIRCAILERSEPEHKPKG